jgi:hypothetical protein
MALSRWQGTFYRLTIPVRTIPTLPISAKGMAFRKALPIGSTLSGVLPERWRRNAYF